MTSETEVEIRLKHCCCCFSAHNLQSTLLTHYYNGETENYADMIAKCFRLEFASRAKSNEEYKICGTCVKRLREAFLFRNLVEITQKTFTRDAMEIKYDVKNIKTEKEFDYQEVEVTFDNPPISDDNDDYSSNSVRSKRKSLESVTNQVIRSNFKSEDPSVLSCKVEASKENVRKNVNDIGSDGEGIEKTEQGCSISKIVVKKKRGPSKRKVESEEKPYIINENDLTCPICQESFPWRLTLERHMSVHFPNHICHICAKSFIKEVSLHIHLKRHEASGKIHTCKECNKSYKSLESLRNHSRFHNDNWIYKCPQCNERFPTYNQRLQHLVDVHGDEARKYKCKHCPKRYKQANALSSHVRAIHLQERRFICKECNSPFFTKSGLNEHMLKHTGIKNFRCDICNKAFGRRYTLIEHMKIHYNIKNFTCTICNKAFIQKCTLKSHMKIHEKS